jgi:hypothetical protein
MTEAVVGLSTARDTKCEHRKKERKMAERQATIRDRGHS